MKLFGLVVVGLAMSAAAVPSPGLSDRVPMATDTVRKQHVTTFEQRNAGWVVDTALGTSDLAGALIRAEKPVRGPLAPATDSDALAKVKTFVIKNADVLGLDANDLARLQYNLLKKDSWMRPRLEQIVAVESKHRQLGFETFGEVERRVSIYVQVYDDGEVGSFGNNSNDVPTLRIRSKAALAKNDARVTANIYGRPFEVFERLGPSLDPSSYQSAYRKKLTAPITAKDLRRVEQKLVVDYEKTARVYTLAYRVELQRGDDNLDFLVDADRGAILREPEPPGPLVP